MLVIFPGALGDFLCLLPSVSALAAARVMLVARSEWLALLQGLAYETYPLESRAVAELYGAGAFDAAPRAFAGFGEVHSWTGHGDEGFAARLRRCVGSGRVVVHPFRAFRPDEHAVEYYARCLGVRPARVRLPVLPEAQAWAREAIALVNPERRPLLVVHAGSGSAAKNWRGFPGVVSWWRRRGGVAVEIAGPAEEAGGGTTGADLVVREALPRAAAVLREAAYFTGNDSGVAHLAAALRRSGVALFGSGSPSHWAPWGGTIGILRGAPACNRCGHGVFCEHRLPVERVTAALASHPAISSPVSAGSEGSKSWPGPQVSGCG